MNIFISSIYSYNSYSRGIMPDVLQTQIKKHPDATIYYLTNSHSFDICYFNIEKKPEICYLCKTGVKNTLKLVEGNFIHLKISDIVSDEDKRFAREFFKDKGAVNFNQVFENFEVGEATLSTYISRTRDRDLVNVDQPFVKELAINALAIYSGTRRFLKAHKIDQVYNFNGRQEYPRAVMRASMSMKIDCYNVERTRLRGHIDFYKNAFPHDPTEKVRLVQKYWQESQLSEESKVKVASDFFQRQRQGESIIYPSYLGNMEKGHLPEVLRNGKKNLVLFNSSDDETFAFGELFRYPLFSDQLEGLTFMVDLVGEQLFFYNLIIRMHPNLKGVNFAYAQKIRDLDKKYPNVTVVPPESSVDSYALMESADKVITFGSTTGLEANFMRKPVILLGKGFFHQLDYAYIPETREEILSLLSSDLVPKPLADTYKIGFFFEKGGKKTNYYFEEKMGEGIFFKSRRVHFYTPWQRLMAKSIQLISRLKKK